MQRGYYKYIARCRIEQCREFLENYWENAESQPETVCQWLEDKGIVRLLQEIVREGD